ncbi:MAG: hypothetical protein LBL08_01105 [Candidatus Nomurabacteria bacterium]|jgi:rRNA-processing protein FCF1|nr:hypothetical protein [Candidatus Nomurabacteria bacterium]
MQSEDEKFFRACRVNGLLIDANLLMVLLIGLKCPSNINLHGRISESFTEDDFGLITKIVDMKGVRVFINPYIIPEISNLLPLDAKSKKHRLHKKSEYFDITTVFIKEKTNEFSFSIKDLMVDEGLLSRIGFTDVSIVEAAKQHRYAILTSDDQLASELVKIDDCQVRTIGQLRVASMYS